MKTEGTKSLVVKRGGKLQQDHRLRLPHTPHLSDDRASTNSINGWCNDGASPKTKREVLSHEVWDIEVSKQAGFRLVPGG